MCQCARRGGARRAARGRAIAVLADPRRSFWEGEEEEEIRFRSLVLFANVLGMDPQMKLAMARVLVGVVVLSFLPLMLVTLVRPLREARRR